MGLKKPLTVKALITIVLFQAISGLVGGIGLINDPTGEKLNIPLRWLEGSPFGDYLIPEIILFSLLGIFPIITAIELFRKKYRGWFYSILLGIVLIIWIIVEIIIIGYLADPPLQLIYGMVGILILALSFQSDVRNYYKADN